ncbi:MAG: tRNA (adenosine(37)-N6)-dimethylallyltransferase MiaA [Parvibaculales bacterium]
MKHAAPPTPPVYIAGPTASGKSALALALAQRLNGHIINADSMQVYAGLRVLTARPSTKDEAICPHHLYGHIAPELAYSVGQWQQQAVQAIAQAQQENALPIVVGGTGLYFHSLTHGLADIPDIPDNLRDDLRARLESKGQAALHKQLAQADPSLAARVHENDTQRILRGLEVVAFTGRRLSEWQSDPAFAPAPEAVKILLMPDRDWLYGRCDGRFVAMLEAGAEAEVAAFMARGMAPNMPAMKALGLAEIAAWQAGEISLEMALSQAQRQTRRYAKRQMTWFRHRMADWQTFNEKDFERNFDKIFSFITK